MANAKLQGIAHVKAATDVNTTPSLTEIQDVSLTCNNDSFL